MEHLDAIYVSFFKLLEFIENKNVLESYFRKLKNADLVIERESEEKILMNCSLRSAHQKIFVINDCSSEKINISHDIESLLNKSGSCIFRLITIEPSSHQSSWSQVRIELLGFNFFAFHNNIIARINQRLFGIFLNLSLLKNVSVFFIKWFNRFFGLNAGIYFFFFLLFFQIFSLLLLKFVQIRKSSGLDFAEIKSLTDMVLFNFINLGLFSLRIWHRFKLLEGLFHFRVISNKSVNNIRRLLIFEVLIQWIRTWGIFTWFFFFFFFRKVFSVFKLFESLFDFGILFNQLIHNVRRSFFKFRKSVQGFNVIFTAFRIFLSHFFNFDFWNTFLDLSFNWTDIRL